MERKIILRFRDAILKTLMEMEVEKEIEIDKLDMEWFILQVLSPDKFEYNREILREDYYKTQRWKRK